MIFCYAEDERAEIAKVAPQPLSAADYAELERLAANCPPLMIPVMQAKRINQMREKAYLASGANSTKAQLLSLVAWHFPPDAIIG